MDNRYLQPFDRGWYRILRDMVVYMVIGALFVLVPLGVGVLGTGLADWLEATIVLVATGAIVVVILRGMRMGTVVADDGITRRGFLGDRHYRWSAIRDFYLHDNKVAVDAHGFRVASRYVVAVYDRDHLRRRRTLFFLDERAFPNADEFHTELNEIVALWQQDRDAGTDSRLTISRWRGRAGRRGRW